MGDVFLEQRVNLVREVTSVEVCHKQVAVLPLPFVAVGLHGAAVGLEGLEVSHLVKQNQ